MDVASLADLLHETAEHHDPYEKAAPPHDWWDWYAAYLNARQDGSTPDEAASAADRYMAEGQARRRVVGLNRVPLGDLAHPGAGFFCEP
jgi:hypothetical protein